uniref:Uncharacterized protein n=1 Tax=Octopus bimaculoides TaxID=37653 RepID=A0A0L8HWW4_OCTBM
MPFTKHLFNPFYPVLHSSEIYLSLNLFITHINQQELKSFIINLINFTRKVLFIGEILIGQCQVEF